MSINETNSSHALAAHQERLPGQRVPWRFTLLNCLAVFVLVIISQFAVAGPISKRFGNEASYEGFVLAAAVSFWVLVGLSVLVRRASLAAPYDWRRRVLILLAVDAAIIVGMIALAYLRAGFYQR